MRHLLAAAALLLLGSCGEPPPPELPLTAPRPSSASNAAASPEPASRPPTASPASATQLPDPSLPPLAPDTRPPCAVASSWRTRSADLLAKGRPYRALRLIEAADQRCPSAASSSWPQKLSALAQIGRDDAAASLANQILAAPSADPAATAAARAALQKKPSSPPPAAEPLVAAALAANARGDADARLQFDRALVQIERETNTKPAVWLDTGSRRPLALSRDGAVALLGHDKTAALASAADLLPTRLFDHAAPIAAGALSPDAKRVAIVDAQTVTLWDADAGKRLFQLAWSGEEPHAVTFSPDGKRLIVAGEQRFDATVRVWNADTGDSIEAFSIAGSGQASAVAVSRDGKLVAVGTERGIAELWSLSPPKRIAELAKKDSFLEEVVALTFSPKGDRLAAVFESGAVTAWETAKGKQLNTTPGEHGFSEPQAVAFSPDGARLIASGRSGFQGVIREWDATSFAALQNRPMPAHVGAFSDDVRTALCAGGGSISVVDTTSAAVRASTAPALPRTDHVLLGAPRLLVVAQNDENALRVFSPSGARYLSATGDYGPIAASLDGRLIARSLYRSVTLWDAATGQPRGAFPELSDSPSSIAFGWTSEHLRAAGDHFDDLKIAFINVARPAWSDSFRRKVKDARALLLSSFGRYAAYEDRKRVTVVDLWDGSARELDDGGKGDIDGIDLSPDGRILFLRRGRELHRFSTATLARVGPSLAMPCSFWATGVSFDGSRLVADCSSSSIKITFSGPEGAAVTPVSFGGERERTLDIAPHGDLIATAHANGRVKLWRFSDGAPLATITMWPTGEASLIQGADGRVAVFGKNPSELTKWLRCRLGPRAYPFEVCADAVIDEDLLAEVFAP